MTVSARRSTAPLLAVPAALLLAGAAVRAQGLQLDVVGGSSPGTISLDAHPGFFPGQLAIIAPSLNTGPTPLSIFDPADPRVLDIGNDLLGNAWFAIDGGDGHMRVGPIAMGAVPALQDTAIFFQAVTVPGSFLIVERVSNPNVIRLANANTFRERFVFFQDERSFATVLPRDDGRWMVAGGGRSGLLSQVAHDSCEIYDPMTDTFSAGPDLNAPRSLHMQTLLPDGRWLISGGVNQNNDPQSTCEVYDPATDTFTPVASMNHARMGHTATLLANGRVLVTGGLRTIVTTPTQLSALNDATATTEIYDPIANTWTPAASLRTPRCAHAAMVRPDGRILFAGGLSWDSILGTRFPAVRSSCDLYDPVANTMVAGPSMASARSLIEPLALANGRFLMAGGITSLLAANPTATAETYDPVANTWTTVGPMGTGRGMQKAWPLGGGRYLLAGGAAGNLTGPTPLASTEVFSTATNTFAAGPSLTVARAAAAMFATPQGQVQLFGGASSGGTIANSTEWYYF